MEEKRPFNEDEWYFERSSGYAGERNKVTDEWVFEDEYQRMKSEHIENLVWENVFRIIKLHTLSNANTEKIVTALRKEITVYSKKK